MTDKKIGILFVCLGNICRSSSAEAILKKKLTNKPYKDLVFIDSAGTAGYHVGSSPDSRMQQEAKKFGYDLSSQIARQFSIDDFYSFDYIVAMDESNLYDIKEAAPIDHNVSVDLMLNYAKNSSIKDVPDPYYGGDSGFTDVINILEDALDNFIDSLEKKHNLI